MNNRLRDRGGHTDDSVTIYLSGSLPEPGRLAFSDLTERIRGLTLINASTCSVWLFFDKLPNAMPDVIVLPQTGQNIPIAKAQNISYQFVATGSASPTGYTYMHYTTELVASSSSSIVVTPIFGATSVASPGYVTLPAGLIFQWGSLQVTATGDSTAFSFNYPLAFTTAIYCAIPTIDPGTNLEEVTLGGGPQTSLTTFSGNLIGGTTGDVYTVSWFVIGQ